MLKNVISQSSWVVKVQKMAEPAKKKQNGWFFRIWRRIMCAYPQKKFPAQISWENFRA